MTDLLQLTATAASGGLFGLFGTALGRVAGYFERRQEHAQERARWRFEAERAKLQMQADRAKVEGEIAKAETTGRWEGLATSIEADAAIASSYPWVDAIRGLTRPALTFALRAISAGIYLAADDAGRSAITDTATFAATAATLWWFGDRGPQRPTPPLR